MLIEDNISIFKKLNTMIDLLRYSPTVNKLIYILTSFKVNKLKYQPLEGKRLIQGIYFQPYSNEHTAKHSNVDVLLCEYLLD